MTKYVVNSGGINNNPALRKKFHTELVRGLRNTPSFLLCNFAQPRDYWETKYPEYVRAISLDMPDGTKPSFELAMPDSFAEQCARADVLYFHGGDDHLIKYWMAKFDIEKIFEGKVIATNSASSNLLAKYYWTCDWRECGEGLGVLPIKFIPHYMSEYGSDDPRGPVDWKQARIELETYGDPSLPIYALKEGEYEVFEK